MDSSLYWVWLQQALGYANENNGVIHSKGIEPKDLYGKSYDELASYGIFNPKQILAMLETPLSKAEEIVKNSEAQGIKIYSIAHEHYPNRLRNIPGPPLCLYVKGLTEVFEGIDDMPLVTIVGARKFSSYGRIIATAFSEALADMGFVIVSGLALGIDSFAHRGALKMNGKTIAVIGAGLDIDYPKGNSAIRELIEENGCVISEYALGTQPKAYNFPMRNRILTGISVGTLVCEAGERSGTLITAGHAISQGKDLFAVPNDIFDENGKGTLKLIKQGARVASSPKDIIDEYYWRFRKYLNKDRLLDDYTIKGKKDKELGLAVSFIKQNDNPLAQEASKSEARAEEAPKPKKPKKKKAPPTYLTDNQRLLYDALEYEGQSAQELSAKSGLDVSLLLGVLTELEIYGLAKSSPGQRYCLF